MVKTNLNESTISLNTYELNSPAAIQIFRMDPKILALCYLTVTLSLPLSSLLVVVVGVGGDQKEQGNSFLA